MRKPILALLVALLLWASPASAAYTLLGHTFSQSSGCANVTTGSVDTSGADLVVAGLSWGTGAGTITDSKSNTWSALTTQVDGSAVSTRLSYVQGGTVGTGHTFTGNASGQCPFIFVAWFSGSVASPFDAETGADSAGAGATSKQPGAITPAGAGELFVTSTGTNGGAPAYTLSDATCTMAITDSAGLSGGNAYGGGMGYCIHSGTGSINPTWGQAAANYIPVRMAAFKPSGGGGGPPGCKNGLLLSGAGCEEQP